MKVAKDKPKIEEFQPKKWCTLEQNPIHIEIFLCTLNTTHTQTHNTYTSSKIALPLTVSKRQEKGMAGVLKGMREATKHKSTPIIIIIG